MSKLITFLRLRLEEDEKAIRERNRNLPIHFVGCYYYNHTLDVNYHCDCEEEYGEDPGKKFLDDIKTKHKIIDICRNFPDVLRLFAYPYRDHPDYEEEWSRGLHGM